MRDRYQAQGPEAEFEPGSRGRVLRNLLGIRSVREMARRESEALLIATRRLIDETRLEQRFTSDDIRRMHGRWLGDIYPWAGRYRQVNVARGRFMLATAPDFPAPDDTCRKGARMPSMAEELATDLNKARSRSSGSRR